MYIKSTKALLLLLFCFNLCEAQQSSKSKAASKVYEKGNQVKLENTIKINSPNLEFSPAFYQNGIVFASSRYNSGERDEKINETYFELFYAELDEAGQPLAPREFSLRVNSHLHEGPVTFSRDWKTMYFTRNNIDKGQRKANSKGKTVLKIYEARKGTNDWKEVAELPFNNDEYNVAHPSLTADGKQLYFASDMPNGFGGMDLYVVNRLADGSWSGPVNLGKKINTEGNELFPFIHSSGNLFFTSDGYKGHGGLDIYMVNLTDAKKKKVYNLGEPFNSEEDDLGMIVSPDGHRGYFSSARTGGQGKDDIYFFEAPDGIWGRTQPVQIRAAINITDKDTKAPLQDADIRIFEKRPEGLISAQGQDLFEAILMPVDTESGELVFKLVRKDDESLGKPERVSDAKGQSSYTFVGEKLYILLISKEGYTTKEVVYSTNGNIGSKDIDVKLERIRCATLNGSVADESTGMPIANAIVRISNNCSDQQAVVVANEKGNFSYCLPPNCDYTINVIKENYEATSIQLNAPQLNVGTSQSAKFALKSTTTKSEMGTIEKGTVIVLENIYYDFNKSAIRSGAARELDHLLSIMQRYASMSIELGSHTDSRGQAAYNQKLSQQRAESAKAYLVARGIAPERIQAIGYGESQLRNQCQDGVRCSEAQHQYNRRTEVKVLTIEDGIEVKDRKE